MEDVFSLVKSLTTGEWQSFQNYLTCFSAQRHEQLKQLQFAGILRGSRECPEEKFCRNKIYGRQKDICFDVLKTRLKDKVLDFLLTDISADKKQELDEADYAVIKIKKKSAQFHHLFYSKKRIPLLYGLLDEIIHIAKKYELYSMLAEHLRLKKIIMGPKSSNEYFEKINKEIEYYWDIDRMVNKAEDYYYELMMLSEYSGRSDAEKLSAFFEKAIAELDGYYKKTKSPLIKYHHRFLELGYYQHCENYLKARSVCLEILGVVRSNRSVYRRQRVGVVYDNLSRCEFYLKHFKAAAEYACEAQKNFNLHSENYCIALEQEFYALFAMKQYENAVEVANKMLAGASRKELGDFRYSKYNYLLANALFRQRRYNETLHLFAHKIDLSKDKTGWETGARVLKIMTLVETHGLDQASKEVSNLKRFFTRTARISPRDKKILNLLLLAERKGFMFSLLNGSVNKYMDALAPTMPLTPKGGQNPDSPFKDGVNGKRFRWEPFTHEVIPFHEWFAGKMKKQLAASNWQ